MTVARGVAVNTSVERTGSVFVRPPRAYWSPWGHSTSYSSPTLTSACTKLHEWASSGGGHSCGKIVGGSSWAQLNHAIFYTPLTGTRGISLVCFPLYIRVLSGVFARIRNRVYTACIILYVYECVCISVECVKGGFAYVVWDDAAAVVVCSAHFDVYTHIPTTSLTRRTAADTWWGRGVGERNQTRLSCEGSRVCPKVKLANHPPTIPGRAVGARLRYWKDECVLLRVYINT